MASPQYMKCFKGIDDRDLDQLVEMSAEGSDELSDYRKNAFANARCQVVAEQFRKVAARVVHDWYLESKKRGWMEKEVDWNDVCDSITALDCYLTASGSGAGLWDGRIDHLANKSAVKLICDWVGRDLGDFVDDSGAGKLEEAISYSAYKTAVSR